jgi:hypothetical protein
VAEGVIDAAPGNVLPASGVFSSLGGIARSATIRVMMPTPTTTDCFIRSLIFGGTKNQANAPAARAAITAILAIPQSGSDRLNTSQMTHPAATRRRPTAPIRDRCRRGFVASPAATVSATSSGWGESLAPCSGWRVPSDWRMGCPIWSSGRFASGTVRMSITAGKTSAPVSQNSHKSNTPA